MAAQDARCDAAPVVFGTFVYQNDGRTETSRITRYVDAAGDIEKLEVMDDAREIVRNKDTVRCYLPHSRVVKVDRRAERGFPRCCPSASTPSRAITTSAWARPGASPASTARPWCSSPRTTRATATGSTPTSGAACSCAPTPPIPRAQHRAVHVHAAQPRQRHATWRGRGTR